MTNVELEYKLHHSTLLIQTSTFLAFQTFKVGHKKTLPDRSQGGKNKMFCMGLSHCVYTPSQL